MANPIKSVSRGTFWLLVCLLGCGSWARPFLIDLSESKKTDYGEYTLSTERDLNRFNLRLSNLALLDQEDLWIIFESQNPGLSLSLSRSFQTPRRLLRIDARSGNVLFVMTHSLYNGLFSFFRESPSLALEVFPRVSYPNKPLTFRLTFKLAQVPLLQFNTRYFIFVDPLKKNMALHLEYDGAVTPKKLRFQINVIKKKKDFQVAGRLDFGDRSYALNNIFGNVVGGVLAEPDTPLCHAGTCRATLEVISTKTKLISLEAFASGAIEQVDASGTFGIYGRTTAKNLVSIYELPFEPSLRKRDVSVLLVPVLGTTELYVHASSLPLSLQGYSWKDTSPISKRLTVKRKLLDQMQARKDPLFIAVKSDTPSEFFLRVEGHRPGAGGTLHTGVSENVSLARGQTAAFLYRFDAHESQAANFELRMDKLQGKALLHLFPCANKKDCRLRSDTWKSPRLIRGSNTLGYSLISYNQPCSGDSQAKFKVCWFLVVIKASENSTFELSLNERDYHRLMIPGHVTDVNLFAGQTAFFKLSNPFPKDLVARILVSFFPHYGSFSVSFSKIQRFPNPENSLLNRDFHGPKAQLTHIVDSVEVTPDNIDDHHIQGPLYLGLRAATTCSLSLKYINPPGFQPPVHYLPEGSEVKGHLNTSEEVAYYRVRVPAAPQGGESHRFMVHLTPVGGQFDLFATKSGILPSIARNSFHSEDNNLELPLEEEEAEYVLGVQMREAGSQGVRGAGQFYIRCGGDSTITRLRPGNFLSEFFRGSNLYAIEISHEMANLLVLKNWFGPDQTTLCANFTTSETVTLEDGRCQHFLPGNQSALYFDTDSLFDQCGRAKKEAQATHCYLLLSLRGSPGGSFKVGFTFNNHPFHLHEDSTMRLPLPLRIDANINFVFHLTEAKRTQLQFHSNGKAVRVYTKLTNITNFDEQILVNFPNSNDFDAQNQKSFGSQTDVTYEKTAVAAQGRDGLLLIAVRPVGGKTTGPFYSQDTEVSLRSISWIRELHRSVVSKDHVVADQWTYFKLFVGPRVFRVRATVSSSSSVHIEARLIKGVRTEGASGSVGLGFQFVEVFANEQDSNLQNKKSASGYYTLAVKCSKSAQISLFWNSEDDEDVATLVANEPHSFFITPAKPIVFTAYVKHPDVPEGAPVLPRDQALANLSVNFYLQSNQKVVLTLSSTSQRSSRTAEKDKHKATVGENGGIASIKVLPKDPYFCTDCYYTGRITTERPTLVTITAQPLGFDNDCITLLPGFTVPEQLQPNELLRFQVFNADRDIMDITINLLAGFIDVYLGLNDTVSETSHAEKFGLATTLQSQKLIIIAPFKYNITGPHMFYLLVKNPFSVPASFSVTADKNNLPTPIQHGVTKMVRLAQGEASNFVYTPTDNDHVALVFELRQVFNPTFVDQALSIIEEYLRVMHVDQQNLVQFPVQNLQKSSKGNKVYLAFDVPRADNTHFLVHVYNPVGSGVIGSVNLLNRGYKLLTYNERFVDSLQRNNSIVYEAYGQPAKYLFVDLRLCTGDVRIDLFQSNFTNVDEDKSAEVQHLKDANNFIHYVKLQSNKIFLKIKNEAEGQAVYQLNVFGENDIDANPFRKLVHGDRGKVAVEWDQLRVSFRPVLLRAEYKAHFWHRVEYTLYLTDDMRAMKYARNCGSFMVNEVLGDNFRFLAFTQSFNFKGGQAEESHRRIAIPFGELTPGVKYFGVIVASVSLFPSDEGILTPIRTETSYYDEFVVKAPHFLLPFERIIAGLFTVAALVLACYLGKTCLFSHINYRKHLTQPHEYFRSDEVQLDFNVASILDNYLAGEPAEEPGELELAD